MFDRKFNFPMTWFQLTVSILLTLLVVQSSLRAQAPRTNKPDQSNPKLKFSNKSVLPEVLAGKWNAVGPVLEREPEELKGIPDLDISLEYGLKKASSRTYTVDNERCIVEIYQMRFPSGAYGFFTFSQSKLKHNQLQLHAGPFLVRIQNQKLGQKVPATLFDELKNVFKEQNSPLPPLSFHLPQTHKKALSEIYLVGPKALAESQNFSFLKDVLSFEGGTEAISAQYEIDAKTMGLLLIEFQTPQLASAGFTQITSLFSTFDQERRVLTNLSRIGNYLVVTTEATNQQAKPIVSEIKYTAKVYWEGDKFSAIPLEFRPPDEVALQEASETAVILLRTFYWIGFMLLLAITLGLIAGSVFFYWRRYQKRKLGIEDLFSDAGGTIQLQLGNDSLDPKEAKGKLLR